MADMYDTTCSSSSPPEPDDISLFLRQILLRSSPSSLSSPSPLPHNVNQMQSFTPPHLLPENQHRPIQSSAVCVPDRISAAESSPGLVFSSSGAYFPASATNVSSSSVGTIDNDPDEYDCESEEGFEALMEETPAKSTPRNTSKRSRAAEVHNLSEKRRRSRINEKMKALQNLIPNSNKTDKASMLDEAIEYLKQLQLQVQMLTMRNGLSLYPVCLPGVLQANQLSEMRMGFYEGNGSLNINMAGTNSVFSLPNQCTDPKQLSGTNLSNIINSETSFGLESSIPVQHGPFQLHASAEEICRKDLLSCQPLKNLECSPILSPQLDGMHPRSPTNDDIKSERLKF